MNAKQAKESFTELMSVYAASKEVADIQLSVSYDTDLLAHNAHAKLPKSKVLLCSPTSGAGRIDALLLRENGCTMLEMKECRGAVESHLNSLRRAGFIITYTKQRYYCSGIRQTLAITA